VADFLRLEVSIIATRSKLTSYSLLPVLPLWGIRAGEPIDPTFLPEDRDNLLPLGRTRAQKGIKGQCLSRLKCPGQIQEKEGVEGEAASHPSRFRHTAIPRCG